MTEPTSEIWARSSRYVPRTFVRPLIRFTNQEASSGIALIAATIAALIWANLSPDSYASFFATPFELQLGPLHLEEDLHGLINDGLMAIFFFVVGLEIKRELAIGELQDLRTALLPALAALGGMVVPALIYLALAGATASRGWGIPMATDIAFAVGVLSLAGRRIPGGAKLFLLSLAIVDDIGAIVVIALFYTSDLSLPWLAAAAILVLALAGANRIGIRSYGFYIPMAIAIWIATLESGVHATIAGVVIGLLTPVRPFYRLVDFHAQAQPLLDHLREEDDDQAEREGADNTLSNLAEFARESVSPLARIEYKFGIWSANLVVPLFALANAGIDFGAGNFDIGSPVALGVALGLLLGKTVGVTAFTWIGLRAGLRLPGRMRSAHLLGVAVLAGIGFTVSIFIAGLAFDDATLFTEARLGIFAASFVAAVTGWALLRGLGKRGV